MFLCIMTENSHQSVTTPMFETIEMPWRKSLLGYELKGPSEAEIQIYQSEEGRHKLEARLAGRLGGYHPASGIVPRGDKITEYLVSSQLSQSDTNIVEVFANTPVEQVLAFSDRFGPLQQPDWLGEGQATDEWLARDPWLKPESLAKWVMRQQGIKDVLGQATRGEYEGIEKFYSEEVGQSYIKLVRSRGQARPQLIIEPSSLLQYIIIKLAVYIAGGALVRSCRECANIMIIGGDTKGYLNRELCSHRCRMRAYRRTQKEKKAKRSLVL